MVSYGRAGRQVSQPNCSGAQGSEEAAWDLVSQYGEAIRRAVRRALNERMRSKFDSLDFVQIVWSSLFRVRDKLDRFECPEELTAYLVAMAQNKVGMEVRRRLMTQKYNVEHEESLDQRQDKGYSDVASRQPAPIDVAIAASSGITCCKISHSIIGR